MTSPQRRDDILGALRRGTVPSSGLDVLAVGLDRFAPTLDEELTTVRSGGTMFKAVRGEYGSGKTFFVRWLAERAMAQGFVTAEVQISEGETPLHRLETVYRRIVERLSTSDQCGGAFPELVHRWFYVLEEDSIAAGEASENDEQALIDATDARIERRLADVSARSPMFATALRGYRRTIQSGDREQAEALLAWVGGQPNVAASAKRKAGIKGDLDHFGALGFLAGLTTVARDAGHPGVLIILDEVETLQRVRSDVRERALNALRQLIDEIDAGTFGPLGLVMTGTPAFFEGPQGIRRLPPLAQRLHVDFSADPRFDNPRAPQIRLRNFDRESLCEVGERVRTIFVDGSPNKERINRLADDQLLADLASTISGQLGGKVGIAPRLYLRKLVADVLDKVDLFEDFDPREHDILLSEAELDPIERNAAAGGSADPDDVVL